MQIKEGEGIDIILREQADLRACRKAAIERVDEDISRAKRRDPSVDREEDVRGLPGEILPRRDRRTSGARRRREPQAGIGGRAEPAPRAEVALDATDAAIARIAEKIIEVSDDRAEKAWRKKNFCGRAW